MEENRPMTKKEMKAARADKFNSYSSGGRGNIVKWIIIGLASVIFLAVFGSIIFLAKQNNQQISSEPVAINEQSGWVKGAENSKVTLVEFGDFQCPACRAYHPVVKELLAGYKDGDVKFVFKHFPLISVHPNAMAAAKAAEAAGAQGKFFEYHDLLYDMQDSWAGLTAVDADAKFVEFAKQLDLDVDKFNEVRADDATEKKIRASMDEGVSAGVAGTPSFFVNGEKIDNPQSVEDFKKIIDAKLE